MAQARPHAAAASNGCPVESQAMKTNDNPRHVDAVLIGGGVMSATVGALLSLLEPTWTIEVFERLDAVAKESTDPWNNAGTGHAALCELNYTPMADDGTIDVSKALVINQQFQTSQRLWNYLATRGLISPDDFRFAVPHMTFVTGTDDVAYLRARWEALRNQPGFTAMEFTEDPLVIAEWAPLLVNGRADVAEPMAATRVMAGTDVDFGILTKQLFNAMSQNGAQVFTNHQVTDLNRLGLADEPNHKGVSDEAGTLADATDNWLVTMRDTVTGTTQQVTTKFVFVGAGGGTLPLLQKAKLPEIEGYAGFPISGLFYNCTNPEVIAQHHAKVYAKAAIGAPPMSVPHIDTRVIDGEKHLMFGPYAGFSPNYLKHGLKLGLFTAIRPHNIIPMVQVGLSNFGLTRYLIGEVLASSSQRLAALRQLVPSAQLADWELIKAGQRVQIIKPDPDTGKGVLAFGTEVIVGADGTIAGLLGASPGASTAAVIALETLERCFPEQWLTWQPELAQII